jgi:ketosteroid isomerase-like protein
MPVPDFDQTIEESHLALAEFVKGDPEPLKRMYSHRDDVSLANPFGPPVRGWRPAAETMERAASNYRDGEAVSFDSIAKFVTSDLACLVEIERYSIKIGGNADMSPVALRVTSVFRPEGGAWKIVHRHADPITTVRSAESLIQAQGATPPPRNSSYSLRNRRKG